MRTWIVRASNDKNVREAVRRRLWALVDSSVNTARWTKVGKGDTVLFVRGDRITHIARVRSTDRSTKPVFAKYPLLIHFAAIDPCQPGLGLTDHMDGDSLREIRRAKGGIVEARGLDVSRLSREGEPAAASPRTAKRTPATAPATPPKARSRARRTSAPVATEPADDPPAPPIERASDAPKPMEPAQPKPAQPKPAQSKPAQSKPVVAEQPKTPVRPAPETSPPLASGSPLPSRRRRRARLQRGKSITGYALRKRLGRGQSAEVWLADVEVPPEGTDLIQGQQVAIKFYLTTLLHWQRQAIRIQREFLVASEIEHHHIVRVHDLVLSPNRPLHSFLVMDYVEGQTLKDLLEDKGALQPRQVAEIGRQLFDALVALHTLDALHRDIKVANVMVKHQPADQLEVVLLDLGIVSVASESGVTGTSVIVGSPHYASLEQLRGEELSVRSDIYGVGATLFHLYTGRAMYAGLGAIGAIVAEMMTTPARLPPDAVTGAERALVDFINRCIENEARHRPRNAEAALEELGGVLAAMEAEAPAGRSKV